MTHLTQQPQIMKETNELVGLYMTKPVPPLVLNKREFAVDSLNNRGTGGLRQNEAGNLLQFRNAATIEIPPFMSWHPSCRFHHPMLGRSCATGTGMLIVAALTITASEQMSRQPSHGCIE